MKVPFFRPQILDAEIDEVVATLRSGWLTTGPRVRRFEKEFAAAVGAQHAVAVNSCTAALHLALEALGLAGGEAVLVPAMTFAATAEVVRYLGSHPILVDCDPTTLNVDLPDVERKVEQLRRGELPPCIPDDAKVKGIIPVHVGGLMVNAAAVRELAACHGLWVVEDAAHAFPAAWRPSPDAPWQQCGSETGDVTCFSFYANKTITTGEGGMAVTASGELADRMRLMSLHGMSRDPWARFEGGSWDYGIVAPGFKYNLTDVAAAIGIHQLARAEDMRRQRQEVANAYFEQLADVKQIDLPPTPPDRVLSWHLFPIRLCLDRLRIDRTRMFDELAAAGVACSVHWRPLHLHPYYVELGWRPEHCPVASQAWLRLISLPIFAGMTGDEVEHVVSSVRRLCKRFAR